MTSKQEVSGPDSWQGVTTICREASELAREDWPRWRARVCLKQQEYLESCFLSLGGTFGDFHPKTWTHYFSGRTSVGYILLALAEGELGTSLQAGANTICSTEYSRALGCALETRASQPVLVRERL